LANRRKAGANRRQFSGQLTGGDSYCYIMALISNLKDTSSNMNLVIITSEQFPLYDVTFGIRRNPLSTDSDQEKLKKNLRSKIAFSWNSFSVRNTIKSLCISPGDYTIEIRARNGSFTERLRLIPIDGEIKQIIEVYRFGTGERLFATPKDLPPGITR